MARTTSAFFFFFFFFLGWDKVSHLAGMGMTRLLIILTGWEPLFLSSWFQFRSRFYNICRCRCAWKHVQLAGEIWWNCQPNVQTLLHTEPISPPLPWILIIRAMKGYSHSSQWQNKHHNLSFLFHWALSDFGLGLLSLTSSSHIFPQSFHPNCSFDLFRALMYFTHIHQHDSKSKTASAELDTSTVCRLARRNITLTTTQWLVVLSLWTWLWTKQSTVFSQGNLTYDVATG